MNAKNCIRTLLLLPLLVLVSGWTLIWNAPIGVPALNYYAPGTNFAYRVYGTPVPGTPTNGFSLLATWTNWTVLTNGGLVLFQQTLSTPTNQPFFFVLTATNAWGESPFSNMALTGPFIQPVGILGLQQP